MAFKLVVALAVLAVCHSSPVIRSARSFTEGKAYGSGNGGSVASASIRNNDVQAYGSNNDGNLARDGIGGYPGQAFAKVNVYDGPNDGIGRVQPAYYPVPAPATVVTYQQYDVETPSQIVYQTPALAQSSAIADGYGTAASNADAGLGVATSNARTQGLSSSATSHAQTNGLAVPIAVEENPTIIAAKHQGLHTVYTPVYAPAGYASSDAKVNGQYGSATSTAKTGAVPTRKSISWRFGTAYDKPAAYAKAAADNAGYGAAIYNADVIGSGLRSAVSTEGASSGQSAAKTGAGFGYVNSAVDSTGGRSNANADISNGGYAVIRSGDHYYNGNLRSTAAADGVASAASNADVDGAGHSHLKSIASSQSQGSAHSAASSGGFAPARSAGWGSGSGTDSQTKGQGSATATAQNLSTEYRVNSAAHSAGFGASRAHSYSG